MRISDWSSDVCSSDLIGVFEAIRIDDTIRRLINNGGDESLIARHAFLNAPNLGSAARALVRNGQTTAEEAIRISRRDAADAELIADDCVRLYRHRHRRTRAEPPRQGGNAGGGPGAAGRPTAPGPAGRTSRGAG